MELPIEIRNKIEKEADKYGISELKKAAARLSDKYRKAERKENADFVTDDIEAVVYSITRMPATFGAVSKVFSYIKEIIPTDDICTFLDVGAGTGSACLAANSIFENDLKITCLEKNKYMRKYGEKFSSEKYLNADILSYESNEKYDMIISSYMLNELNPDDFKKIIRKLWSMTGKILAITEPGTPAGYEIIKKSREILLNENAHIISPCVHENECVLSDNDWCHFTSRISRTKLHKALKDGDVPYEDEKFSYVAFSKNEVSHKGSRILRHPYIEKGKITLNLCTENEIKNIVVTKKNTEFKAARKAECGDLINI